MTWVLLAGLVLLAVAVVWRRRSPKSGGPVLALCGLAFLVLAGWVIVGGLTGDREPLTITFEAAAGKILAEQVVPRLESGDTVLLLRYPAVKANSREITLSRARAFEREALKAGLKVVHGGPDPLEAGVTESDYQLFDYTRLAAEVSDWCKQHAEVKAVVSLLHSLPTDLQAAADTPPWYGFDAGRNPVSSNLGLRGPLAAVVLYGPGPESYKPPPRDADARALFDARFVLVTRP